MNLAGERRRAPVVRYSPRRRRNPKRPRDPNQLAKLIVDIATGEVQNTRPAAPTPATEARRKGGLKGGKARAKKLSPQKRRAIATQGYSTQVSPPGPDGGVDSLAGRGPMGFDAPRLCVQVKSGDDQQDTKTTRELTGVMKDLGAEQGLLVSWSGFWRTVHAEARRRFFDLRLWDAADIVAAVLEHYNDFPADLRAELPLKRVWALVAEDS